MQLITTEKLYLVSNNNMQTIIILIFNRNIRSERNFEALQTQVVYVEMISFSPESLHCYPTQCISTPRLKFLIARPTSCMLTNNVW